MKSKFLTLLVIVFVLPISIKAQDIGFGHAKGFFTTDKFRVATSLSFDMSFANKKGKAFYINSSGNIDKENISYASSPNISFGLGLDFFSPMSTLGFYIEPTYNIQKYTIKNTVNSLKDSVDVRSFEIPVYLKLRFGNPESKSHTWLAFGGGYSFINKATTKVMRNNLEFGSLDSKKQFQSVPYLSAILGWEIMTASSKKGKEEIYERDDFRVLLFAKANYDLGNRFDNTEVYTNTALHSYSNPELKFLRVSVGVKFLLRFSKLGEVTSKAVEQSLKK